MNQDAKDVDVAIVGGGVAGSALAIVLNRAGLRVAVAERERRFRDRVRGDALFPWGALEAERLGIADVLPASGARPLPIWQTYEDRAPNAPYDWRRDVPSGDVVWGVDHPGMQEALFELATTEGAISLRPAKALALDWVPDGRLAVSIEQEGGGTILRSCLVIGADGSESGVRRWIGARTAKDPVHHLIGGCLIEDVDLDPDAAHVAEYSGGMTLLFRHGSGRVRAYLVCSPGQQAAFRGSGGAEAFIAACAKQFPEGAFDQTRPVGPVAFFPSRDVYSDRVAGEGIVLIGDAAGANDPAQGQGLSLAFRDIRELRDLLLCHDSQNWQAAIEEFARRRQSWYEPLRAYALWEGPLTTDVGPEADRARARFLRVRELDPFRNGYGLIHALGPDTLPVTEEARRHYLGEDLHEGVGMTG